MNWVTLMMMVFPIIWTKIFEVDLIGYQIKNAPVTAGAFLVSVFKVLLKF